MSELEQSVIDLVDELTDGEFNRLRAKVERLKKEYSDEYANGFRMSAEIKRLRAEVERLTAERDAARECEARMHLNMLEVMEERDRALKEKP